MTGPAATGDRPSRHGQMLGKALAAIADAGYEAKPGQPERCLTCAFRAGSMPNQTAGTLMMAMECLLRIDSDDFACHHGMKDGEPTRFCAGYQAAIAAPFQLTRNLLVEAMRQIEKLVPGAPDEVRIAFDAWLKEVDPDQGMDVYQAARAYAKHGGAG